MDHYITIVANDKLRSFPLMTSDLRGQGHSGLPLQPLQSSEKFLLLLFSLTAARKTDDDDDDHLPLGECRQIRVCCGLPRVTTESGLVQVPSNCIFLLKFPYELKLSGPIKCSCRCRRLRCLSRVRHFGQLQPYCYFTIHKP